MALEVRCGVCGSTIKLGDKDSPVSQLKDGIAYLVPEKVRHEDRTSQRMEILKAAGVNVDKLQELINGNSLIEDIFGNGDPIIDKIKKGGFIRNKELFRRFITAQTMRLIKDKNGWTAAVRKRYNTRYVYKQTLNELILLNRLQKKCPNDKRFTFFTLDDLKSIFHDLVDYQTYDLSGRDERKNRIMNCTSYQELLNTITGMHWRFSYKRTSKPRAWLNCFKGAGAYYTLQNLVRTHGLVLTKCKDMKESLELIDVVYKDIIGYTPRERRWDILMSVLTKAVIESNFEFKY